MNSTHACLRRQTPSKCSPHPWGSAFGPPVRASKIVPNNFVEQRVKDAQARVNHLTHKMLGAFCSEYAPFGQMPRMASGASILAKAFANHFPVVCPTGQPTAVQNRSRRFCRGELTADWRTQNPDKNAGAHFCTASGCPQGEQQEAASELISGENSAAALLERIKAEREATTKLKRKAKS